MGNKKKRKVKKEKKPPEYRNKEERKAEVKHILEQLTEFQLNITFICCMEYQVFQPE